MSTFSVAPMLHLTDRHYRHFMREVAQKILLYTEMIVVDSVIRGNKNIIELNSFVTNTALQLGGNDPNKLFIVTKLASCYSNYNEINFNCGCPSPKVENASFGAILIKYPSLVAECLSAMASASTVPISIKTRIGLDYNCSYKDLFNFISAIYKTGIKKLIIHARPAILKKLSPKKNLKIPALNYEYAYQIKQDFPMLEVVINGGIKTLDEAKEHVKHVDGVMIGRTSYHNPYIFKESNSRYEVARNMIQYIEYQPKLSIVTRHLSGLFYGTVFAKQWRYQVNNVKSINEYIALVESVNGIEIE